MKKITLLAIILFAFASYNAMSQTIVGTTPENKKVILEEFTGIHCTFCPDGHAIANAIKASDPDNVFLINIHVGSFATPGAGEPDFRTSFGTAIGSQSQLAGYPAGTINRHYFGHSQNSSPSGATALGRGTWTADAATLKTQSAYVNVGVEAQIDATTRELTVHVEGYYTGDSPESTNLLNVALMQNNTLGPQTGGNMGSNYVHQHRLVHMLTGQWGEVINTTTTGSFVDRTFTYTLPADYHGITAELGDFEVVAFISETHQEIVNGNGAEPTYTGISGNNLVVREVTGSLDNCTGLYTPTIEIYNSGGTEFTSLDITYSINGAADQVHTWTGSLGTFAKEFVEIPNIAYSDQSVNTITISTPADDDVSDNAGTANFDPKVVATSTNIVVEIKPDNYGSETTWEVIDVNSNAVLLSGGPYTNSNTTVVTANVSVPAGQCYAFKIFDSYGDGMDSGFGVGYYKVFSDTDLLVEGANFGAEEQKGFNTSAPASTDDEVFAGTQIFPNPTKSILNVNNASGFNIELFDVLGRRVYKKTNIANQEVIDVARFTNGTYMLKLYNDTASKTEKIIILN